MQVRHDSGIEPLQPSDAAHAANFPQDGLAHPVDPPAETRSLADDLGDLFEDARTYFDAEMSYQKSRAGFVANRLKKTIAFGAVAAYLAVLATIGLTVGLIIALTPLITAWGATALVVLVILLVAYLLVRKAASAWADIRAAMASDEEPGDHD
ncbi:phage holin family protein [Aurantiacibacter rhizosphaerae]|uniref:Phage holin family protein n=1 Tax=Aurantiacibacter rhizosphaerae TaxID=2691582 RepID=A0A844XC43_9SPHN|nr:phage holin family protein [Aurantiacibacter rhizosphaerae]MWV28071.1 phage holin family protein [Aurantiacibacter rhizosphaerae]